MGLKIYTCSGQVEIVSYKEFIKLIKLKEWANDTQNIRYFQKVFFNFFKDSLERFAYNPGVITLPLIHKSVTYKDLTKDLTIESVFKDDLRYMIEDITTESAKNMGDATHIIRMGPRLWMAANPKNFEIHYSNIGYNVANYYPNKSICWSVNRY